MRYLNVRVVKTIIIQSPIITTLLLYKVFQESFNRKLRKKKIQKNILPTCVQYSVPHPDNYKGCSVYQRLQMSRNVIMFDSRQGSTLNNRNEFNSHTIYSRENEIVMPKLRDLR